MVQQRRAAVAAAARPLDQQIVGLRGNDRLEPEPG